MTKLKISIVIIITTVVVLGLLYYFNDVRRSISCKNHRDWDNVFDYAMISDAGKYCTDSDQCESSCVRLSDKYGPNTGECYDGESPMGTCVNYVEDGKIDGGLCIID